MKKRAFFLLPVMIIIIYQLLLVYAQTGVGVGLQILDTSGPLINLIEPINSSGNPHGNITFAYNVSDASNVDNCSLIINNKINLTDTSITKNARMYFTINGSPAGSYNWSINCTDNLVFIGAGDNRTFSVVFLTNFNTSKINLSTVNIKNVTNFIVETSGFGKINFSEGVDLSQGYDLNKYINISFNKIELDSTVLLALNKSATLQITGLTFSKPRIKRDGVVCPETICKEVSYITSGGILTFNVTHFTSYEAEETPGGGGGGGSSGGGGGTSGGGGGGGPSPIPIITDFSTDKTALKVVLKQGQTKTETLSIKNTGTTIFDIKTDFSDVSKFKVSPTEHEITTTLQPNEEKTIELIFKALENEKPDIYPAKIKLKSPSVEKEIAAVVEVDSAEPLFDVDIDVLPQSKKVFAGQEVLTEVNLFNVRGFGRVDVSVEYSIKDLTGNVLTTEHETLAVETQAKFTRSLLVPSDLLPGTYVVVVKVIYGDSTGVSSDLFEVQAKTIRLTFTQLKDYRLIILISGIVMLAIVLIFSGYKFVYIKKKAPKTKEEAVKVLREEEKAQKLRKELEALESAYKSGFISEESYQKDKKRIEDKLNRLK